MATLEKTELERKLMSAQMKVMKRNIPEGTDHQILRDEVEETKKHLERQTEENKKLNSLWMDWHGDRSRID